MMLHITFEIPKINFKTDSIMVPTLPRIGDQIFLTDFISKEEEDKIQRTVMSIDLDAQIVKHVSWFMNDSKRVYFIVTLASPEYEDF